MPPSTRRIPCLDIGLVNNMPDSALKSTELQFRNLLEASADDRLRVRIHYLALDEVARSAEMRAHMRGRYRDAASVAHLNLDALIVTGMEPRAKSLRDEPYWASLTHLIDWAERNTISTIWSCLAAHAAVLHLDEVGRQPLGFKRVGVFDCARTGDHPLLHGLAPTIQTPHSRYNEVQEEDLRRAGYRVLTRSPQAGVDLFVKERGTSLFVFFQGHPEYEGTALLREYRRDVLRFLHGAYDEYPAIPQNVLDPVLESELMRFAARAKARRRPDLASELPELSEGAGTPSSWRQPAVLIYRNWLNHIAEAKRISAPAPAALMELP
jgi:homoserine O-succinyltransferase/O-acetyltransferase